MHTKISFFMSCFFFSETEVEKLKKAVDALMLSNEDKVVMINEF